MKGQHTELPWDYFVGNANGRGLIRIEAANCSDDAGQHIASMSRGAVSEANAQLITTAVNTYPAVTELVEALDGLIIGATAEFNEKGAGGYALARLSDARSALHHYRELAGTSNEGAK